MSKIKERLDAEVLERNSEDEISYDKPDPLLIARRYNDEYIALICALFAYGNVQAIIKFLDSLDFSLLEADDEQIRGALSQHYYRFQNAQDIIEFFIVLKILKKEGSLETHFLEGYLLNHSVVEGVYSVIEKIRKLSAYESQGFNFLVGKVSPKTKGASALKRWMMFLRWMVRNDTLDMGLWKRVDKKDLLMPLDTHTFNVSLRLKLLKRKTCDLEAVIELSKKLRSFDKEDPIKYDFALYRLGQEKIL